MLSCNVVSVPASVTLMIGHDVFLGSVGSRTSALPPLATITSALALVPYVEAVNCSHVSSSFVDVEFDDS